MRTNKELQKMLVEKIQHYRDSVSVFKIRNQNAAELHKESVKLSLPYTSTNQASELRYDCKQKETHTILQLQENATFRYYHASGYKHFQKNTNPGINIVSENADKTEKEVFVKDACNLLEKNGLNIAPLNENIQFEKIWLLKSAGIAPDGSKSVPIINRLVYAYRRFIEELPVLGSASVFIKTAGNYELDAFGIDWRNIHDAPLTKASIVTPEDAAIMALEQLQNTNPEMVYSPENFAVDSFELGYFSHAKTMYQTIMQPVYVAKFISKGFSRMGHIIAVSAAGTAYESICRKLTAPPFDLPRTKSNDKSVNSSKDTTCSTIRRMS